MIKLLLEDIMWDNPIKVKETVSVGSVSHLLLRYRINGILVVKAADENQLVGIFTAIDSLKLIDDVDRERVLRVTDQLLQRRDFNLLAFGGSKIKNFNDLRFRFWPDFIICHCAGFDFLIPMLFPLT